MDTLKRLNYIYGANGTGKTTVSNIIKNLDGFNNCSITWQDNIALNTFVYNKKFINEEYENNISTLTRIKEPVRRCYAGTSQ